ncbi:hypothetical protein [Micromonospora sp. NPDC050695]|uniref:hypothetical protein n=1 Tax=Micromonospora sp. NPDC050695 TaxID=3154938 RepID=UPI0033D2E358
MPLRPHHTLCWIVTADHLCGDTQDFHSDDVDRFLPIIAEVWARFPDRDPLVPWQHDGRCLLVVCRWCGVAVGDGDHFADAEHAWAAAEEGGWLGDVCPFCRPANTPE